ncbi:hypothetical protein [Lapidilactobacillus bayanensis]|uniref:hypothetical protein n=1 Tax=Lapidilactobacillus bayanensis TaxID=2485998 RepID=UPI000F793805|nr:hypothetical protein [Lapidilactobacillus bayanensis]
MSECQYCHFEDKYTYSAKKMLYKERALDNTIRYLGCDIMRQDDGIELTINVNTQDVVYQRGVLINYCPMCGRKLGNK